MYWRPSSHRLTIAALVGAGENSPFHVDLFRSSEQTRSYTLSRSHKVWARLFLWWITCAAKSGQRRPYYYGCYDLYGSYPNSVQCTLEQGSCVYRRPTSRTHYIGTSRTGSRGRDEVGDLSRGV